MIDHQLTLIRRELWEHRSIFVTPVAIASIVILGVIAAMMFASGFTKELDMVLFGVSNVVDDSQRRLILSGIFGGTSSLFLVALAILTTFYCLDSLYAERKDKSILFWRSLPVTDAETVVSKLLTAVVVIPLISIAAIIVTNLVNLIALSLWVTLKGADAGLLIWGAAPFIDNWLATLIAVLSLSLWVSPLIGWFLLVSAFTKRWPFMVAFLPPIVAMLGEKIIIGSTYLWEALLSRGKVPLFPDDPLFPDGFDFDAFFEIFFNDGRISMLGQIDLARFFTSPQMWGGLIVCGLLVTGAIYVRRFRDDS